jgi:hypothetical protein
MVVRIDRAIQAVAQQRAKVVRKAVGVDSFALDQAGIAERSLLRRAPAIDEHHRSAALLQMQCDANPDDSCA